jgi:chromosomal replication initiation ATPase DnaA
MTTQADSIQYTQSEYKRLYNRLLNDHENLKIRYTKQLNENKLLTAKIERPKRIKLHNDIQKVKNIINNELNVDIDVSIRYRDVVDARSMYYYWVRHNTLMSLKKIADTLETRHDHSTLIHSISMHEDNMQYDKVYKAKYEIILAKIEELKNTQNENLQNMFKRI